MYKAPSFGLGMKKDLRESIESVYDINNTINEEEQLIISLFEEFLEENFHVDMLTEEDLDYIIENEFPQWLEEQKNRSFIGRALDKYFPGYKSSREDLERGRKQTLSQNLGNFVREIPNTLLAATPAGRAAKVLRLAAPAVSKALQKSAKRVATGGAKKGPPNNTDNVLPRMFRDKQTKADKADSDAYYSQFLNKNNVFPPSVPTSSKSSRLMSRIKTSQEIGAFQKAFQKAAQKASRNVSKKPPPARNAARNVSQKPPPLPSDTAAYAASRIAAQKASQKAVKAVTDDFIAALKNLPPRSSSVPKILKKPSAEASATKVPANAAKASATKASATAAATTRNLLPRIPQTPEPEPESKRIYERPYPYYVDPGKDGLLTPRTNTGMPLPAQNPLMPFVLARKNDRELNAQPSAPPVGFRLLNPPPPPPPFSFAPGFTPRSSGGAGTRGLKKPGGEVSLPERKPVPTPGQNSEVDRKKYVNQRKVRTVGVTPSGELQPEQNSDSGALTDTNPNGGARTPVVKKRKPSVRRKSQPTRSSVDRVMKNTGAPAPPFKGGNTATWTDDGKPVFKSDTIPKRDALRRKSRRPSTRRSPSKTRPDWAERAFTSER